MLCNLLVLHFCLHLQFRCQEDLDYLKSLWNQKIETIVTLKNGVKYPSWIEFQAKIDMIMIVPNFTEQTLYLFQCDVGPFKAGIPLSSHLHFVSVKSVELLIYSNKGNMFFF